MKQKNRGLFVFSFISSLFCFFIKTGVDLVQQKNIIWTLPYTASTLIFSILVGGLMGALIVFFLQKKGKASLPQKKEIKTNKIAELILCPLCSWILIMLSWLPGFLAYFPGICAYDCYIQMSQCASGNWIDHHPYMHTWLLNFFWRIGTSLFQNANIGIAIFSLFQMSVLAGAMVFSIRVLKKHGCNKIILWILLGLAMLYPFNMFMSISMTKDILFAAAFLVAITILFHMMTVERDCWKPDKWDIGLLLVLQPIMWYRNNAKYALVLVLLILLLMWLRSKRNRKQYGRIFLVSGAAFLFASLTLSITFRLYEVQQGDRREMLSIPIQQLSRTLVYHEEEIDAPTKEFLNKMILNEAWRDYNPAIADPVKRNVVTSHILQNAKEFITIYCKLGVEYLGDYVNAVLAVDAGYLYPLDESAALVNLREGASGLGYVQTAWVVDDMASYGVTQSSLLPGYQKFLEDFCSENAFLNWPIVKYLLLPGGFLWAYIYCAGILWYQKKYKYLFVLSFIGGYYLTLLLGPTVQLRYLYCLMISLPVTIAFASMGKDDTRIE